MARVAAPVSRVYEAVADPDQLSRYFTTGGAEGRLETGATVSWDFADFPGAFPVEVVEAEAGRHIVLRWEANDRDPDGEAYQTEVRIAFEPVEGDRTEVAISEQGWRDSETGLKAAFGNCMGWSQMLCALKAWVEHGINLRDGMYK
jgi:uncharacterized protein YndB with AHSA1/START domain